jgi:hypothetical protein
MYWVGQETMISIIQSIEDNLDFGLTEKVQRFKEVIETFMDDTIWEDSGCDIDDMLGRSSAFDIALGSMHIDWFE